MTSSFVVPSAKQECQAHPTVASCCAWLQELNNPIAPVQKPLQPQTALWCRAFGPSAAAAQLEGSKAFLKVQCAPAPSISSLAHAWQWSARDACAPMSKHPARQL